MPLSNTQINPGALFTPAPPAGIQAGRHAIINPATPNQITVNAPHSIWGRVNLVIDVTSAVLNACVQAALASGPVAAKTTEIGKGVELSKYFHTHPSAIPAQVSEYTKYKAKREEQYKGTPPQASLDVFCVADAEALCRERAILLHIALAEAGVSSRVCFGLDPGNAGHVWVEYPAAEDTTHLWDPTQGLQLKSKDIIVEQQSRYPSNQQSVVLVIPR